MVKHRPPSCHYCDRPTQKTDPKAGTYLTKDHVVAKIFDGTITVPCCFRCNQAKGHGGYEEFVLFVKAGMLKRSRSMRENAIAFEAWWTARLF